MTVTLKLPAFQLRVSAADQAKLQSRKRQIVQQHQGAKNEKATTWKAAVPPELWESVAPADRNFQEIIYELLLTERQYVATLTMISLAFRQPVLDGDIIPAALADQIFSNVEEVRQVNLRFLAALESRYRAEFPVVRGVDDIFVMFSESFSAYETYCGNQEAAFKMLMLARQKYPEFAKFLVECHKSPACAGLTLDGFLLTPMQRITRYPLLLKAMLAQKGCDANDVPDNAYIQKQQRSKKRGAGEDDGTDEHAALVNAYHSMMACVSAVNEAARRSDDSKRRRAEAAKAGDDLDPLARRRATISGPSMPRSVTSLGRHGVPMSGRSSSLGDTLIRPSTAASVESASASAVVGRSTPRSSLRVSSTQRRYQNVADDADDLDDDGDDALLKASEDVVQLKRERDALKNALSDATHRLHSLEGILGVSKLTVAQDAHPGEGRSEHVRSRATVRRHEVSVAARKPPLGVTWPHPQHTDAGGDETEGRSPDKKALRTVHLSVPGVSAHASSNSSATSSTSRHHRTRRQRSRSREPPHDDDDDAEEEGRGSSLSSATSRGRTPELSSLSRSATPTLPPISTPSRGATPVAGLKTSPIAHPASLSPSRRDGGAHTTAHDGGGGDGGRRGDTRQSSSNSLDRRFVGHELAVCSASDTDGEQKSARGLGIGVKGVAVHVSPPKTTAGPHGTLGIGAHAVPLVHVDAGAERHTLGVTNDNSSSSSEQSPRALPADPLSAHLPIGVHAQVHAQSTTSVVDAVMEEMNARLLRENADLRRRLHDLEVLQAGGTGHPGHSAKPNAHLAPLEVTVRRQGAHTVVLEPVVTPAGSSALNQSLNSTIVFDDSDPFDPLAEARAAAAADESIARCHGDEECDLVAEDDGDDEKALGDGGAQKRSPDKHAAGSAADSGSSGPSSAEMCDDEDSIVTDASAGAAGDAAATVGEDAGSTRSREIARITARDIRNAHRQFLAGHIEAAIEKASRCLTLLDDGTAAASDATEATSSSAANTTVPSDQGKLRVDLLCILSLCELRRGNHRRAKSLLKRARQVAGTTGNRVGSGKVYRIIASIRKREGNRDKAIAALLKAQDHLGATKGRGSGLAEVCISAAELMIEDKRRQEGAIAQMARAKVLVQELWDKPSASVAELGYRLGALMARVGNLADAEGVLAGCVEACERVFGVDNKYTIRARQGLRDVLGAAKKYKEAASVSRRIVKALSNTGQSNSPEFADAIVYLGAFEAAQGQPQSALKNLSTAYGIYEASGREVGEDKSAWASSIIEGSRRGTAPMRSRFGNLYENSDSITQYYKVY